MVIQSKLCKMTLVGKQKWRNRVLERGVVIDRSRGYVYVRYKRQGLVRKELIGRTTDANAIDRANFRSQQIRHQRRTEIPGFEARRERLLIEDAADLFFKLHGQRRTSSKGIKQFTRYSRLMKQMWSGRYVDTMTGDDMRDYRYCRSKQGAAESTINREQTAIITLFNKLAEWRKVGQIPRNILLPDGNPGRGVKKVNEDRFVRDRLLSDEEFKNLWACSDQRMRRIILAEMNLPLRLEDLRQLSKRNINAKLSQFKGIQAKTGREYTLPINEAMWALIRTTTSDKILDFTGFRRRWERGVKRAGLKGLQFRDLRRTAATALHDSGVSLKTISAMLGHAAVTTTIRYLGLKNENLKQAGDILAAKYRKPVENRETDVESVPESVPTIYENGPQENKETDRKID